MRPIKDEVIADQKNDHLRDQRQRGERAVAVFIERDQPVGGGNAELDGGVSELGNCDLCGLRAGDTLFVSARARDPLAAAGK
jgi:hypothetical protein